MHMDTLSLYETMHQISGRMVDAARANDWVLLAALGHDVARLRDALSATESPKRLTPEERARKMQLIRGILADDAEVRRHTEPWMESIRKLLGAGARQRGVRRAYGV